MVDLLFSVRGRINRAQYWLGSLLCGFALFAGAMVAGAAAGAAGDSAGKGEAMAASLGVFALILLPLAGVTLWCAFAVQIKRFHDRGRPWWVTLIPLAPLLLLFMAIGEGIARNADPYEVVGSAQIYLVILQIINLAFFVDLGCLPGEDGPNKYGPPPGSPRAPATPKQPSGAVGAASSLFGAQSAMDRAIAEQRAGLAAAPAYAGPAMPISSAKPAPASFGRRAPR